MAAERLNLRPLCTALCRPAPRLRQVGPLLDLPERTSAGRYNSQRLSASRGGFGLPRAMILGLFSFLLAACAGAAEPLTQVGPLTGDPTASVTLVSIQGSACPSPSVP